MHFLGKQLICDFIIEQSLWKHLLCGMPLSWKPLKLLMKMLSGTFKRTCTTDLRTLCTNWVPCEQFSTPLNILSFNEINTKRCAFIPLWSDFRHHAGNKPHIARSSSLKRAKIPLVFSEAGSPWHWKLIDQSWFRIAKNLFVMNYAAPFQRYIWG